MFQRRHYNKIAELLKSSREKEKHPLVFESIIKRKYVNLCYDFAIMFSNDNPNFQSKKFYEACGLLIEWPKKD